MCTFRAYCCQTHTHTFQQHLHCEHCSLSHQLALLLPPCPGYRQVSNSSFSSDKSADFNSPASDRHPAGRGGFSTADPSTDRPAVCWCVSVSEGRRLRTLPRDDVGSEEHRQTEGHVQQAGSSCCSAGRSKGGAVGADAHQRAHHSQR